MNPAIQVLFEDHHLIAVRKPAPMLTQAPPDVPSLEALVKEHIKQTCNKPAGVYLGIPHRLDRPVTGVVLFARNSKAAARVAKQFHDHTVAKTYWALVEGVLADDAGSWRDFLRKIENESRVETVSEGVDGAREALTNFSVLKRLEGATLLEMRPRTGRMHQLRIQAARRGFPIVGDWLYGGTRPFGPPAEHSRDRVVALHARSLTLEHPFRKQPLTIEAPLPESWSNVG
jgi:23S rRNA pseudouridine1911/1915/1917 synthase